MANPPRPARSGTLVSGNRDAEPAHATPAAWKHRRTQPATLHCTARRGSLGRTGGLGWGGTRALVRTPTCLWRTLV